MRVGRHHAFTLGNDLQHTAVELDPDVHDVVEGLRIDPYRTPNPRRQFANEYLFQHVVSGRLRLRDALAALENRLKAERCLAELWSFFDEPFGSQRLVALDEQRDLRRHPARNACRHRLPLPVEQHVSNHCLHHDDGHDDDDERAPEQPARHGSAKPAARHGSPTRPDRASAHSRRRGPSADKAAASDRSRSCAEAA